eukprot:GHVT01042943.1.p1 GENE.GHVT01042943.1~~GHVT01042943.1.p1  ORF type:complete len:559 (-),score=141.26 GHVT01042943.1:2269-3945(-)
MSDVSEGGEAGPTAKRQRSAAREASPPPNRNGSPPPRQPWPAPAGGPPHRYPDRRSPPYRGPPGPPRHRSRSRSLERFGGPGGGGPERLPPRAAYKRDRLDADRGPPASAGGRPPERRDRDASVRMQREMEEARRDDLTVLILNVSLKADERDLYEYFSTNAGKIRDIQLIRDSRSGRPKGVAYIELYTQEAVLKALAASGHLIKNQPIRVQSSMAEKNRAARAAKAAEAAAAAGGSGAADVPLKLYVGNLTDELAGIRDEELRELFEPFGEVSEVDLPRDPYTDKCKGFAYVTFPKPSEGQEALQAMDGFELMGRPLKVGCSTGLDSSGAALPPLAAAAAAAASLTNLHQGGLAGSAAALVSSFGNALGANSLPSSPDAVLAQQFATQALQRQLTAMQDLQPDMEKLDDEGGGLITGATSKHQLMQKLMRADNHADANENEATQIAKPPKLDVLPTGVPTCYVRLGNMYDPADPEIDTDEHYFPDLLEDVEEESKKYGRVCESAVSRRARDGSVCLWFDHQVDAVNCANALSGRFFAGKLIDVQYVDSSYFQRCKQH